MHNPSAFGVALLVLVTATLVGPSEANDNRTFNGLHPMLRSLVTDFDMQEMLRTYQQPANIISLDRATIDEPHWLTVSIPVDTELQGEILINDTIRIPLEDDGSTRLDLSPYFFDDETTIKISGRYQPASAALAVIFDGPSTLIQQQTGNTGELNYQLTLVVD
jgi:hypothetical protein